MRPLLALILRLVLPIIVVLQEIVLPMIVNRKEYTVNHRMFTGLIEAVNSVKSVSSGSSRGTMKIVVDLARLAEGASNGDSIAVNGVCLTIAGLQGSLASFDLSAETVAKSTLGRLKSNSQVNLERALKADGRFGGHFVLGHVDGTARLTAIDKQGQYANLTFIPEPELLDQIIPKGSIAIDGISLTIANLHKDGFSVAVIPETLSRTTLGSVKIGDIVNIETDVIVKTVAKQLARILPISKGLTVEKLKEMGF